MSDGDVRAPVRRWFDSGSYQAELEAAMKRGDQDAAREAFFRSLAREVFSPNCVMHFPDGDGGISRIIGAHLAMAHAFPDLSSVIDDLIAERDLAAVRGRIQGTLSRPFRGMQPTGKHGSLGYIAILRVRDGRITEGWGYNDLPGFLSQLGLSGRPGDQPAGTVGSAGSINPGQEVHP